MKLTTFLTLSLLVSAMLCQTSPAHAATAVETGAYTDLSAMDSYFTSGPGSGGGTLAAADTITGLSKFDPSLGTLTGVTIDVPFAWEYTIDVFADTVTDDSLDHSIEVDAPDLIFLVGYSPSSSTSSFSIEPSVTPGPFIVCFGFAGDDPCSGSDGGFGSDGLMGGSVSGLTSYVPADFIGVGAVDTLFVGIGLPEGVDFILDNVDAGSAGLFADLFSVPVTLTYTYTPVPEPASLVLLGLGGLAIVSRRWARA